ncbi:hypothetical protein [Streptomyces kebangsaanensis]|uniref:hypothetical protein n=1 Tax=Streptomyces kebangsaanensis TaxID=864058 RepID=UPI00093F5A2F|nr:hypothetical protein [Streptomyces kebangsaanensis]
MREEVEVVLSQILSPVATAIGVDGLDVFADRASGSSQGGPAAELGRRILRVLRERSVEPEALREAVAEVAANTADEDARAVLRLRLRKALSGDVETLAEVTALLPAPSVHVTVEGERSVAIGGNNTGLIFTGDNSSFITGHVLGGDR